MNAINTLVYSNRTDIRVLRHVLFWVVDLFNYFIAVYRGGEIPNSFIILLFKIPFIILATYYILYYVLPLTTQPGNRWRIFLSACSVLFILGLGMRYYKFFIVAPLIDPGHETIQGIGGISLMAREIFESLMVIFMAIAIKTFKSKTELERRNEQLTKEKRQAELSFLKAQMHPHFLFNTLNTLYSETIQDSGKAQQVILHLSSLMRFILEQSNKPLIPITHEVKVIQDFIALEKIRHGERLHVHFTTDGLTDRINISPLILLPFVENSFKHSLLTLRGDVRIEIQISFSNGRLYILVINDHAVGKRNEQPASKGIANIQRQLELIYEKDYSLVLNGTKSKYKVYLTLPGLMVNIA